MAPINQCSRLLFFPSCPSRTSGFLFLVPHPIYVRHGRVSFYLPSIDPSEKITASEEPLLWSSQSLDHLNLVGVSFNVPFEVVVADVGFDRLLWR